MFYRQLVFSFRIKISFHSVSISSVKSFFSGVKKKKMFPWTLSNIYLIQKLIQKIQPLLILLCGLDPLALEALMLISAIPGWCENSLCCGREIILHANGVPRKANIVRLIMATVLYKCSPRVSEWHKNLETLLWLCIWCWEYSAKFFLCKGSVLYYSGSKLELLEPDCLGSNHTFGTY